MRRVKASCVIQVLERDHGEPSRASPEKVRLRKEDQVRTHPSSSPKSRLTPRTILDLCEVTLATHPQ